MSWYLRSLADADTHRGSYSTVTRSVHTHVRHRVRTPPAAAGRPGAARQARWTPTRSGPSAARPGCRVGERRSVADLHARNLGPTEPSGSRTALRGVAERPAGHGCWPRSPASLVSAQLVQQVSDRPALLRGGNASDSGSAARWARSAVHPARPLPAHRPGAAVLPVGLAASAAALRAIGADLRMVHLGNAGTPPWAGRRAALRRDTPDRPTNLRLLRPVAVPPEPAPLAPVAFTSRLLTSPQYGSEITCGRSWQGA
jgi:hypothetical protein